jgi:hypothetical protein
VWRSLLDDRHVLGTGADVRSGRIAATERVHHVGHVVQQIAAAGQDMSGRQSHHRLAAAVVQTGDRALVGHGLGQPEHIGQAVSPVGVVVDAAAADGLAQCGGVDGDEHRKSGAFACPNDDFLMREHVNSSRVLIRLC